MVESNVGVDFFLSSNKYLRGLAKRLRREYGGDLKNLPFKNRALQMISTDKERSAEVMRDWLKES